MADPLSKRILGGEFAEGDTALVDRVDGEYTFEKRGVEAKARVAS